jgi:hypothetical protein
MRKGLAMCLSRMRFVALLSLLLVLPLASAPAHPVAAQDDAEVVTDYSTIVAEFVRLLEDEGFEAAVEYFFATNPVMQETMRTQVRTVMRSISSLEDEFGRLFASEVVADVAYGERLAFVRLLAYLERAPIVVEMTFYRTPDSWVGQNFNFTGDYRDLLLEAVAREDSLRLWEQLSPGLEALELGIVPAKSGHVR